MKCKNLNSFLYGEIVYAEQARDLRQMTTVDEKGQLPVHQRFAIMPRLAPSSH